MIPRSAPDGASRRLLRERLGRVPPWLAAAGLLLSLVTLLIAMVEVTVTGPRVYVRWRAGTDAAERIERERRYDLRNGEPDRNSPSTWQYELGDRGRTNLAALLSDPQVEDTHNIDGETLTAPSPDIRISRRSLPPLPSLPRPFPFNRGEPLEDPREIVQLQASLWLWVGGAVMLLTASASSGRTRRNAAVAALLFVAVAALSRPIDPSFVRMGEAGDHGRSRSAFETYFEGRIRYEKHLSQAVVLQVYRSLEPTEAAPRQALALLARAAVVWFVLSALLIAILESWSAAVLRYLGLALLAPATLLYFGWREFGYLSLNVAVFPLLARGLRNGGARLELGSTIAGLGAALHGSGLVSLAGAWLASLGTSARLQQRTDRALRVAIWGAAAYLGWILLYITLLGLPIDPGQPRSSRWRPWFADEIRQNQVAVALVSATGARDLSMTAWVVGAPLLLVAGTLWRRFPHEVRVAFLYSLPSLVFVTLRWPFWGIGHGVDLVVAGFPAVYALAWVCAQDAKRTAIAAVLLVSAHVAFWWIVLDRQFDVIRL